MVTENAIIMQMARESLKRKWGLAIVTHLVYFLLFVFFVALMIIPVIGPIIYLLIWSAMPLGFAIFTLSLSRKQETKFVQIFHGFKNYGTSLRATLLMALFVLLRLLLLIVPGIIALYSYIMIYFIIADDNSITAMEALNKSKRMMDGYKWKLFCLQLRFIGWSILSTLTLYIGYLWFFPYHFVSFAMFYDDIKAIDNDLSGKVNENAEEVIEISSNFDYTKSNAADKESTLSSIVDTVPVGNEVVKDSTLPLKGVLVTEQPYNSHNQEEQQQYTPTYDPQYMNRYQASNNNFMDIIEVKKVDILFVVGLILIFTGIFAPTFVNKSIYFGKMEVTIIDFIHGKILFIICLSLIPIADFISLIDFF